MNIKAAFEYARNNAHLLAEKGESVVGVAYCPGSGDGEFQLWELVYQTPESEDDYPYIAYFHGGNLFSTSTTEEVFSGDTLEEVIEEMNGPALQLHYQCCRHNRALTELTADAWLIELFPQLPNPESEPDSARFRNAAIGLISSFGNNFQATSTLN